MTGPITLTPIGVVRGGRAEIFEDHWGGVIATLILDPAVVDPDATLGLGEFSHLEVIFHFHRESWVRRGAAHPGATRPGRASACSPATPQCAPTTLASPAAPCFAPTGWN